jgi:hypothetical protein
MQSFLGVLFGLAMVVGGVLVFRYAEGLAGVRYRPAATGIGAGRTKGPALEVALNRAFALGVVVLGIVTVAFFAI